MKLIWTLEEAVDFCRRLEKCITGFNVGVTGSVLHRGGSNKDLDIIVFPNSTAAGLDIRDLQLQFVEFGMRCLLTREQVTEQWRKLNSLDTKHVEIWCYKRKRIDIFYLD